MTVATAARRANSRDWFIFAQIVLGVLLLFFTAANSGLYVLHIGSDIIAYYAGLLCLVVSAVAGAVVAATEDEIPFVLSGAIQWLVFFFFLLILNLIPLAVRYLMG